jgi:ribonuclease P protein component
MAPPAAPNGSDDEPRRHTFPRSHRLKRQRLIRSLFDRERDDVETVAVGCVRLLFRVVPRSATGYDVPIQVGFAPGRRVDTAVARNRIRRLLREVYRVHQHDLVDLFVRDGPLAPSDGPPTALIVMALFRGDPARADTGIPRDLPEAMRQAATQLRAAHASSRPA